FTLIKAPLTPGTCLRVYTICAASKLRCGSGNAATESLRGTSAIPLVIVTESTLKLVFGGMALVTAGFNHFEGPFSKPFIRAEATFAGLLNPGREIGSGTKDRPFPTKNRS